MSQALQALFVSIKSTFPSHVFFKYGSVAPIKDEDGGSAVIYAPGKGKRMKDEKKLKVLR